MKRAPERLVGLLAGLLASLLMPVPAVAETVPPLHSLADFPIGAAVPAGRSANSLLASPERQALVRQHFDSITAENIMKMAYLQPLEGGFTLGDADALVDWAREQGAIVHGHALVWHNQAPAWMNGMEGPAERFEAVLEAHVRTVAAHFAGRVTSWDVVNEAFTDEDPSTWRDTIWYRNIGPKYLELAFRWAHDAAPDADLYYNDYDISGAIGPHKLERVLVMLDDFLARGVPIHGIGFQVHVDTETPTIEDMRAAFSKAVARGVKVRISELDVSVNQHREFEHLDEATAELQRQRYADVVRAYLDTVPPAQRGGITLWGLTDGDSWIPGFRKRPDWPLLFNADFTAKPALRGFAEGLAPELAAPPGS